jgi:hypothetical protein
MQTKKREFPVFGWFFFSENMIAWGQYQKRAKNHIRVQMSIAKDAS